jgi:circadian clock protein KaiC
MAMEFLVRGARQFNQPGLFVSFEETAPDLIRNFSSLGFDLGGLIEANRLKVSHVAIVRNEIVEAGVFSLDALLLRLERAIAEVGAQRVVLDTMDTIFAVFSRTDRLRGEIARLFHWLREKQLTVIVTGERGDQELTRQGFEEYVCDCVIRLDHRTTGQNSRRRLQIVKYRGSGHDSDEFPFLIGSEGVSVLPITSISLDYAACTERVSTGVEDLDEMLNGKGYFKATTVLVSGRSGTGKSTLAAAFALAACNRGERCLYFAFEESPLQIMRNMQSVGIDLYPSLKSGLLTIRAFRPSFQGLEEHLVSLAHEANNVKPTCVVLDPITNFVTAGGADEVLSMLTRVVDLLKRQGSTIVMTGLTFGLGMSDESEVRISSLIDTWIALDAARASLPARRTIHISKSRGMDHCQETREFRMSSRGLSMRSFAAADPGVSAHE